MGQNQSTIKDNTAFHSVFNSAVENKIGQKRTKNFENTANKANFAKEKRINRIDLNFQHRAY